MEGIKTRLGGSFERMLIVSLKNIIKDQSMESSFLDSDFLSKNAHDFFEDRRNLLYAFYDITLKLEVCFSKIQKRVVYFSIEPHGKKEVNRHNFIIIDPIGLFGKHEQDVIMALHHQFDIILHKRDEWNYCYKKLCFVFSDTILESIFLTLD